MTDAMQLAVPIDLQALLVNQPVLNGTKFRCWSNNYKNLINSMQSPTPNPFQEGGVDVKQGIHLHWRLPRALTHGRKQAALFSIHSDVDAIVDALKKGSIPSSLSTAFEANDLALSDTSVSLRAAENAVAPTWSIADWGKGRKYSIVLESLEQGQGYLTVADESLSFPIVPNRWLVMRFLPGMTRVEPKCWIIEADAIDAKTGVTSFLNPKARDLMSENASCSIGSAEELTPTWTDPGTGADMFLRAIGPGNVTFSAYAPAAENVFSFVDADAVNLPNHTALTYVVAGWYANPGFDPLRAPAPDATPTSFRSLLDRLNWTIAGVADMDQYDGPVAETSVYHGMVHSLTWQIDEAPSGSSTAVPQDIATSVKVVIGNTSVEALTALVGATAGGGAIDLSLLEALQYGVLGSVDQVAGRTVTADKMRQARYGSKSGGLGWEIVAGEQSGGSLSGEAPPDLTTYAQGLATLNQDQRSADADRRALATLQSTLYARWWKYQNFDVVGQGPTYEPSNWDDIKAAFDITDPDNNQSYTALVAGIRTLQAKISKPYSDGRLPLSTGAAAVKRYATDALQLPGSLTLKATNAPRYWQPRDPVVLVSGVANAGADHSTSLPCRRSDQIVSGLKIDGAVVTAAGEAKFIPLPTANADVPALITALCQEAFFLDPGNADNIAANLFEGNVSQAGVAQAITEGSWADPATFGPASVALTAWKQPWMPLFLEWQIKWYPTYAQTDQQSPWTFDRSQWAFDGDDYEWTGTKLDQTIVLSYSGRTVLSSHAIFNFEERLRDFIDKSPQLRPDLEKVDELLENMKGLNILSQSLGGLHQQFLTRNIGPSWPPTGDIAGLIQDQYAVAPDPTKGDVDCDYGPAPPSFFPKMGGFFVMDGLTIVDAFGQSIDLMQANNNPTGGLASAFTPIRSPQVTPNNPDMAAGNYTDAQFIAQSFGLLQPTRLMMRWIDADADGDEVGLAAGANPVCGWLLPNHLDAAIYIYDQAGRSLGEMRVAPDGSLAWLPAPDSPSPISTPNDIPNVHLRALVIGLQAAQGASSSTFDDFSRVIDETLWLVDPLGGRSDSDLSVLIGRPLALMRMSVGLEMEGAPYTDQSWADTFEDADDGVSSTGFDLRLGSLALREDGLIGYYEDGEKQAFNSVHYPDGLDQTSTYVEQIGGSASNYVSIVPNAAPRCLTLLMDPRGSVHGSTGILPVKQISVPPRFVDAPLKAMEVTFEVTSLLTSAQAIQIPRLSEQRGDWSWLEHTDPKNFSSEDIVFTSTSARLASPTMVIRDGWLKFRSDLSGDT